MNADGMPSLWVQTVCVYSVRGLSTSNALIGGDKRTMHVDAMRTLGMRRDKHNGMAHMKAQP